MLSRPIALSLQALCDESKPLSLSILQAVDGIFHVCRAFDDADVVHVEDRVDPVEGEWAWLPAWGRGGMEHGARLCTQCRASDPLGLQHLARAMPCPLPAHADLEIVHSELRAKDIERIQAAIESLKKLIPR